MAIRLITMRMGFSRSVSTFKLSGFSFFLGRVEFPLSNNQNLGCRPHSKEVKFAPSFERCSCDRFSERDSIFRCLAGYLLQNIQSYSFTNMKNPQHLDMNFVFWSAAYHSVCNISRLVLNSDENNSRPQVVLDQQRPVP